MSLLRNSVYFKWHSRFLREYIGTQKSGTKLPACNYASKFINKGKNNAMELIRNNLSAEKKSMILQL